MDSFTLSVMYETAVCEGGNSAKSQDFEVKTGWGRKQRILLTSKANRVTTLLNRLMPGIYTCKFIVGENYIETQKLIVE